MNQRNFKIHIPISTDFLYDDNAIELAVKTLKTQALEEMKCCAVEKTQRDPTPGKEALLTLTIPTHIRSFGPDEN